MSNRVMSHDFSLDLTKEFLEITRSLNLPLRKCVACCMILLKPRVVRVEIIEVLHLIF